MFASRSLRIPVNGRVFCINFVASEPGHGEQQNPRNYDNSSRQPGSSQAEKKIERGDYRRNPSAWAGALGLPN